MRFIKLLKVTGIILCYFFVAIILIIAAGFLSAALGQFFIKIGVSSNTITIIAGMLQGVMAAIAAALVIYELRKNARIDERETNIKEAQFILNYNQAFIQDKNMYEIESVLERKMEGKLSKVSITDENRQQYINYLVYLEGMAPIIIENVLKLEHIDALMAYRYYLAVNNPELQEDQLFAYPDYYKGCFRLYEKWTSYRKKAGEPILQDDSPLDRCYIRRANDTDNMRQIAELIYYTDPFIYPAAFNDVNTAKTILPEMMRQKNIFSINNIFIALKLGEIIGIAVVLSHQVPEKIVANEFRKQYQKQLPKSFEDVCERYFNSLPIYEEGHPIYIACISVHPKHRKQGIGRALMKQIVSENSGKTIMLESLADNVAAIHLYQNEENKFTITKKGEGYAYKAKAPQIYTMVRHKSEEKDVFEGE